MKLSRAFWLTTGILGTLVILFLLAVKSGILMPFVVGFVLAYLLSPLVDRMTRWGLPRTLAAVIPVAIAVSLMVAALALGVPLLVEQLSSFVQRLPVYMVTLQHFVLPA